MGSSKRQRQKQGRQARRQAEQAAARRSTFTRRVVGIVVIVTVVLGLLFVFAGGGNDDTDLTTDTTAADEGATTTTEPREFAYGAAECPPAEGTEERRTEFDDAPARCTEEGVDYSAVVTTSEGEFTIDLLEDQAPGTVNNFVFLARWNYYDGDDFHRAVQDFVIQAGDPVGDPPGTGGPGYQIQDELPDSLDAYERGVVAMANAGPDTNGSQWFVYLGPNPLPGPSFSIFGRVTEGMEVVEAIEALAQPDQSLSEPVTIDDITIVEA